ncbi:IVa2 protein [Odocoileus adenovirus 1]|uniref:IVa2 protein n=2 Tax=Deer atadenovirus A TaxID=2169706 RepID=A0A515MFQ4_9ADEN|nr:IVa2 protein [Odocoileus adenovirus 1]QDM55315.1 IVa2 protein [Deer atadenovirus A]ASU50496.1 IVa2 protein [Odocoileus adenovirus 1]ASU50523.1 IVa2 protein [Odocoileus adenovirus 1]ASU50550.1 IVa2 protein [Odocoileus adenovirus 1]
MEGHNTLQRDPVQERIFTLPIRQETPKPKTARVIDRKSFLGRFLTEALKWRKAVIKINPLISKDPFPDDEEIFEKCLYHGQLMHDLHTIAINYQKAVNEAHTMLHNECITSINYGIQPFIITIYGPTGSGKSQFIRNIISGHLIQPSPETVFFITPEKGTIPTEEKIAWEAQCIEGNYDAMGNPLSKTFQPVFIPISFREAIDDNNLNLDNPENIFCKAAEKGPICIIIDECMNQLGSCHSISSFFHALPSKIFGRFSKCTGYTVLVVLHNMNPRHDRGNIKDLKIQSKCHVISPQLESTQITRFIKNYSFGFPPSLIPVLKDIIDHARMNSKYSWLIYNNVPVCESFRWSYYSPSEQIKPIFMDLQGMFYNACAEIRKVFRKRAHSQNQYVKRISSNPFFF